MAKHNELGQIGEKTASEFLISKGFIIRDMNWRVGRLEIDIVAQEPSVNLLHIIEVKTRSNVDHFDPMDSIKQVKIRNLVNAANGYFSYYQLNMSVQFDVMILVGTPPDLKVLFIPNAFEPPLRTIR